MRRLLPVLVLVQACAPPTSMMVEFTTNLPCPTDRTAPYLGIGYGGDENDVETSFNEVVNGRQCDDATGVLGTYAFRPLPNDREQTIFLKATLAPAGDIEAFCSTKSATFDARRCVIARRRVRFTPGATLRVPLLFHDSCLGKPCDVNETCVIGGRCVSKILITPTCRPNETCVVELDAGVGAAAGGSAGGGSAAGGSAGGGGASGGSASGGSASGGSASGGSASGGSASGGSAAGGSASGGSASGGSASGGSASGGSAAGGSAAGGSAAGGSAAGGSASGGSAAGGNAAGGSGGTPNCDVFQRQFCGGSGDGGCCLFAGIDAGVGVCSNPSSCAQGGGFSGLLVRCIDGTDCGGQNCWVRDNQTLCMRINLPSSPGDRRTCTQNTACIDLGMPDCNPDPIFPFVRTCQCDPLNSLCSSEQVCSPATRQCVPRGVGSYNGLRCGIGMQGTSGLSCTADEVCCAAFDGCIQLQQSCTGIRVGCRSTQNCPPGSWCSYDRLSGAISSSCLNGIEAREGCDPTEPSRRCEGGGVCTGIIDGGAQNFGYCQ